MSSDQNLLARIQKQLARWTRMASLKSYVRSQSPWKLALLFASIFTAAFILFIFLLFLLVRVGYFYPIPTYSELASIQNHQASEIYDREGKLLGKYYLENRINADSSEVPTHLVHALIATEDARFFEHGGIDLRSLLRVLVKSILLSDDRSGGGSTISQQLAKNLYPRNEGRSLSIVIHKIREMLIARRLEKIYSKDQIIRLYLNTVPFGGNAFGIKVASQRFFNKDVSALGVHEGAVLIGMLKATTSYNPVLHPDRSIQRRNLVLKQMNKFGYLNDEDLKRGLSEELVVDFQAEAHNLGLATYFREHLRGEAQEILNSIKTASGQSYNLYTDGLRLRTTLDRKMQQYAEEALKDHLTNLHAAFLREWRGQEPWLRPNQDQKFIERTERYRSMMVAGKSEDEINLAFAQKVKMTIFDWEQGSKEVEWTPLDSMRYYLNLLRAGMLVIEPQSGDVLSWVGGVDHRFIQYDHVKSSRQVGSLIKPIVYAAAIREGIEPCRYTENKLVQYPDYENWEPRNSDGKYGGYYSMEGALSHSINTVAVDLALQTGLQSIKTLANSLGIQGNVPLKPAIALGAVEASLWEMIQVYGTFANRGTKPNLHFLEKIEAADGQILWMRDSTIAKQKAITTEQAAVMNHLLCSVVDSGTAQRLRYTYQLRGEIAGKTGTTQDQSDGWFVGYTSKLVAGVWVGAEVPGVHFRTIRSGQGANSALPIWAKFMQKVRGDSQRAHYHNGHFTPPRDTTKYQLNCPPYLPELPILFDSMIDAVEMVEFSKAVEGIDPQQLGEIMEKSPRRTSESLSDYSQRIKERNEKTLDKRARRKKRKAFVDKLFGKKKK